MNFVAIILAGAGGGLGALLRYLVSGLCPFYKNIPTGTLIVNFIGSTMLSVITFGHNPLPYFADAGILGGFTTFSTFSYESFHLLDRREYWLFVTNVFLSLFLCGIGVVLGKWLVS